MTMNIRQISRQLQQLNEFDKALSEMTCDNSGTRLRAALHSMTRQALKGSQWRLDYDYAFREWVVARRVA